MDKKILSMNEKYQLGYRWMNGWMEGWVDERKDGFKKV